jgi:hypothetical protein
MFGRAPQLDIPNTAGEYAARLDGCVWEGAIG